MTAPLSRRALLSGGVLLGATGWLGACTTPSSTTTPGTSTAESSSLRETSSLERVLLAYFSRAGENYYYGGRRDLDVGNTEVLARIIAELTQVDVHRIEAAQPYTRTARRHRGPQRHRAERRCAAGNREPVGLDRRLRHGAAGQPHLERPGADDHVHLHRRLRLHRQDGAAGRHLRRQRPRQRGTRLRRRLPRRPDRRRPRGPRRRSEPGARAGAPLAARHRPQHPLTHRAPDRRAPEGRRRTAWRSDLSDPWRSPRSGWAAWASASTTANRWTRRPVRT